MAKFESTFTNWENGQIGATQKTIKAMNKVELMDFTTYCIEQWCTHKPIEIIKKIRNIID